MILNDFINIFKRARNLKRYTEESDLLSYPNRTVAKIISSQLWVESDTSLRTLGHITKPIVWCKPTLRYMVRGVSYETEYSYIPQDSILSEFLIISYNDEKPANIKVIGSLDNDSPIRAEIMGRGGL